MRGIVIVLSFFLFSCSMLSKRGSFEIRDYKEKRLSNGLQVIQIPDHSLPRVSLVLLVKSGVKDENKKQAGMNSFVAQLLERGTQNKSAVEVADTFGGLGTQFSMTPGDDFTMFSASSLGFQKKELLDIFSEVMIQPAFKESEVRRLRSQVLSRIKKRADSPGSFASFAFASFLYGDHPYGRAQSGTERSIRRIKRKDIIRHYFKYYRPNNAILAVVGDYDSEFLSQVETQMLKWSARDVQREKRDLNPSPAKRQFRIVAKNDLKQTQIRLGHYGISRSHPDYFTLKLANVILGGTFASRLNSRIRDDLGLTYSIYSSFSSQELGGMFTVSTFTRNDKVGQTVAETLKLLEEFGKTGVTDEEMKSGKALLQGVFPRSIETADKLARNLLVLKYYGVSDDYLNDYLDNVNKITKSQVNAAIRRHITPDKLKVLVYAPKNKVRSQLKKLGRVEVVNYKKIR